MIPSTVSGHPVIWIYRLDRPRFPARSGADAPLEKTSAVLLSVADEGSEDERFLITCLGESGRLMTGETYYTLADAKRFAVEAFDGSAAGWAMFEK
jgi:hypothetical protein